MTSRGLLSPERALPAAAGALVGFAVAQGPTLGLLGLVAAGVGLLGLLHPPVLTAYMFLGVLFDRIGATGSKLGDFPITASKLAVLGGLGIWGARCLLVRGPVVRWHPVLWAMLGIVVMTATSIAIANCMYVGKYDLAGMAMMTVMVALVYTILAEARLLGLYRLLAVVLLAIFLLSLAPGASERGSGTFGDPNEWATTVLLLTPTLLGGIAPDRHPLARPLRVLILLLAPLVVLRSGSRSAFAVGLLVVPGCAWLLRRRPRELAVAAVAAAVAVPLVLRRSTTLERLRQLLGNLEGTAIVPDNSLGERSELFQQGVDLFRSHWLLGSGPGTFSTATGFLSTTGEFRPAHNTYLEIAAEQGVVGLIPFAVFTLVLARTLVRAYRASGEPTSRSRVLGLALGLTAVVLMAATLGLLTFSIVYLVLGLALAVTTQAQRSHAA
jgi:O-antigen ligase